MKSKKRKKKFLSPFHHTFYWFLKFSTILFSRPSLLFSQVCKSQLSPSLSTGSHFSHSAGFAGRYRVLRSRSDLRPLKDSNPVDLCSHSCAEGIQIATQTWAFCLLKCSLPCLGTRKLGSLSLDWTMLGKLLFSVRFRSFRAYHIHNF